MAELWRYGVLIRLLDCSTFVLMSPCLNLGAVYVTAETHTEFEMLMSLFAKVFLPLVWIVSKKLPLQFRTKSVRT